MREIKRYTYKGKTYTYILEGDLKDQTTREWSEAVLYNQDESGKNFMREKTEFYSRFKSIMCNKKIIIFKSPACAPCKAMEPIIDVINNGKDLIEKKDIYENVELAHKFGLRSVPAIVVVDHDDNFRVLLGQKTKEEVLDFIKDQS